MRGNIVIWNTANKLFDNAANWNRWPQIKFRIKTDYASPGDAVSQKEPRLCHSTLFTRSPSQLVLFVRRTPPHTCRGSSLNYAKRLAIRVTASTDVKLRSLGAGVPGACCSKTQRRSSWASPLQSYLIFL